MFSLSQVTYKTSTNHLKFHHLTTTPITMITRHWPPQISHSHRNNRINKETIIITILYLRLVYTIGDLCLIKSTLNCHSVLRVVSFPLIKDDEIMLWGNQISLSKIMFGVKTIVRVIMTIQVMILTILTVRSLLWWEWWKCWQRLCIRIDAGNNDEKKCLKNDLDWLPCVNDVSLLNQAWSRVISPTVIVQKHLYCRGIIAHIHYS